ncbi:MAG: hypothetical protein ACJAUV_000427 [Flavobacteriales bacterium]|jgi:hypothetical protein
MKQLFFISVAIVLSLALVSCSGKRRTVTFDSVRPADISVDANIKRLLLVDRTKFDKNFLNIVEGLFTGEMPGDDKAAAQSFISNLQDQLSTSSRFQQKNFPKRLFGNSITAAFPDPLKWNKVASLCLNNQTDAVIAIEVMDTDYLVTEGKRVVEKTIKKEGVKQKIQVDEFFATGKRSLTLGIRFYNPKQKTIIDEQWCKKYGETTYTGTTATEAMDKLLSQPVESRGLSGQLGRDYAFRIAPMNVKITRAFIGKHRKSPALEQGTRYADVGQWKEAINIWKQGLKIAEAKPAKFLAYNIAVGYEMMGDISNAVEWAQLAYIKYNNAKAKTYVNLLNRRVMDEQKAAEQLNP